MPAIDPARRSLQSKHAAARRWHTSDADDLGRTLAEARLADYITRVVNSAPKMTAEQCDRLAVMLRPVA